MKIVARKSAGSRKIIAPRPKSAITPDAFAEAFGAKTLGEIGEDTNPFSLLHLRDELSKRLRSTGGRPALENAADKWKISVLEEDVEAIKRLSDMAELEQYKPSPAQIATMLIHMALGRFSSGEIANAAAGFRSASEHRSG